MTPLITSASVGPVGFRPVLVLRSRCGTQPGRPAGWVRPTRVPTGYPGSWSADGGLSPGRRAIPDGASSVAARASARPRERPGARAGSPGGVSRYSVVIPALDEQDYLGACLASLAGQDYPAGFEIIVVDNDSTDATAVIAAAAGATVVFEPERGVCQARQRGTEAARGEIIISTDADTTFPPGWLSGIDLAFARHPAAVAVAGPCLFIGAPRWGSLVREAAVRAGVGGETGHREVPYVSATNIAFRRAAWTGYDTRLTQGGDELDLLRRLQAVGEVVFDATNPTHTSSRRLHQGLLYNTAVTFFYYYLLGYLLNRAFRRPVLGTAPPFRPTRDRPTPDGGPGPRPPNGPGDWPARRSCSTSSRRNELRRVSGRPPGTGQPGRRAWPA